MVLDESASGSVTDHHTLVLLDELATGTDPGEGVGLSIAVLEELHRRGAVVLATTHFNEIKAYARETAGFRNARMAFDEETLQPLYRLDMGEAGDSYAFVIARKLGIPESIVQRAKAITGGLSKGDAKAARIAAAATGSADDPSFSRGSRQQQAGPIRSSGQRKGESQQARSKRFSGQRKGETQQERSYQVGDVVWVPSLGRPAAVYRTEDERGNLTIQIQGEKQTINRKRVRPFIESKHLYPDNYDLDIEFDTVENRKKRKLMGKRHVEGLTIEKRETD